VGYIPWISDISRGHIPWVHVVLSTGYTHRCTPRDTIHGISKSVLHGIYLMLSTGYKMLSTGVTPYPVGTRLYPVDTILISIRGVDSVHIPWTTHIPWVISRGQHVISRGQHVISRGYIPWTTLLPWVTPVENTYPVGTISRGLHVPTGYKVLSTGYDIPWVISRGLNKFNRCRGQQRELSTNHLVAYVAHRRQQDG